MELNLDSNDHNIRKIEDIIDIQKAKGCIDVRQVAFKLPSKTDSNNSAGLTKSLESGLTKFRQERHTKKAKKLRVRPKRTKTLMLDTISWPSDSDITVLRLKTRTKANVKNKVGSIIAGDGLHQRDSSSMINLATLMLQSQQTSKQSLNLEELLLPLTSWEHAVEIKTEKQDNNKNIDLYNNFTKNMEATTKKEKSAAYDLTTKSKVARFLRLYFCPCCSCLYKIEKMQEEPSAYFTVQGSTKTINNTDSIV